MKIAIILALLLAATPAAHAELSVFTGSQVYSPSQPLVVRGQTIPDDNLIIRLFAPDGTIARFDQTTADELGSYSIILLTWPEASAKFPFGTYVVEVLSPSQDGLTVTRDIRFTNSSELIDVPIQRHVQTDVFVPETSAINDPLRVFVQATSDGLLIEGDPKKLLATTHVHLPDGTLHTLTNNFETLHQGLYYADYTPDQLGTYVFHVVTFHQGTVSHGSAATTVLSQDIRGISEQIIELNDILDQTSDELDRLKQEIEGFGSSLEKASDTIDSSVTSMSGSVTNIEEASIQLNSLLFPIVAAIAIIVAAQIVLLARRR